MPDRGRPGALGWLQALSAVGNMLAAVIGIALAPLEMSGAIGNSWRPMFVMGVIPALLAILIMRRLKEPEKWQAAAAQRAGPGRYGRAPRLGAIGELFGHPPLPRPVRTWSLTMLREKLIKIGAKVVCHAKAVTFQLAVPWALFAAILDRISPVAGGTAAGLKVS